MRPAGAFCCFKKSVARCGHAVAQTNPSRRESDPLPDFRRQAEAIMATQAFSDVPRIEYEGPKSRNPLAFKHYNAAEKSSTANDARASALSRCLLAHVPRHAAAIRLARARCSARGTTVRTPSATPRTASAWRLSSSEKLGAPYYCWHDRDVAPEGRTLAETNKNLDAVVKVLKEEQQAHRHQTALGHGQSVLQSAVCPRRGTSCNADVFAFAAAQVKKAMEVTHELGGEGYTFWGGREGYMTLLNTDMKREQEHLAKFLHMAVDHKKAIGFKGQFYIEPKPKEPTKHQYDSDAAACLNFLREYDLLPTSS
jgi:xylose isomerase